MQLDLTEVQRLLQESAQRFLSERYDLLIRKRIADTEQRFSPEIWQAFAQMGWLGLPLSQEDGGFGGGPREVGLLMEAFGKALVLEPYLSSVLLGGSLIAASGTASQRVRWLKPLVEGRLRIALAHGESMFESLPGAIATRAQACEGGWILDGDKPMVLDAPVADSVLVSARLGDPKGSGQSRLALFMVPVNAQGLALQRFDTLDGRLAGKLQLRQVRVAQTDRLGEGECLQGVVDRVLDAAIAALCAEAVGCMQYLLDATVAYTRTRVQFDRPLSANQVLRHRMVDMAIQVEEGRAMALRAAFNVQASPALRTREVSGAKLKISRAARFVAENAIQLHGAMGVTEELAVGAYARRLLAFEKTLGTVAEHERRLADAVLRRAA